MEEGMVETCDEMITASVPHPPTPLWGGSREFWSEAEPGKQGRVGEGVFKI